ncbi:SDR family oxidoreductase [Rhizobium sp. SIMBA_035]
MAKTMMITGSSTGYGKAAAEFFLDKGWNVLATMRQPEKAAFADKTGRLKVLPLDITGDDSIRAAIASGIEAFGTIDAFVNNAGIGLASAFEATPDAVTREIFETNSFGVFTACRAIIPVMRRQGGGTIINVTSSAGIGPMPMVAVYCASKWAVEGFTESLAYELEPFGINARLVEPGYAPTTSFTTNSGDRMNGLIPDDYGAYAQTYFQKMANYPTPYCTEQEVAEAIFAAATNEARQVRYLAGADTRMVADLRWTTSDAHYTETMRKTFSPQG